MLSIVIGDDASRIKRQANAIKVDAITFIFPEFEKHPKELIETAKEIVHYARRYSVVCCTFSLFLLSDILHQLK